MRKFAEQEIVIPDGQYAGFRFSCERQPHSSLWFDAIDSGMFKRHFMTGPTQGGKSLIGYVIPTVYHLCELGERVALGVPRMEMAAEKWRDSIEPVIAASRYRDLLPKRGAGSRGGKFESVVLRNGAILKFMSGGGDDKKRASFTAPVLIVTETDGLDEVGDNSREADPLRQMEGRIVSYGERAKMYAECTVSIEAGRTWQEIKNGTDSRIATKCPHCGKYVTLGRESLVGWQGAEDELTAKERSAFYCDLCGTMWSEADRLKANMDCVLVHKGQEVTEDGQVVGGPPRTLTLGYRFTTVNNMFRSAGAIGVEEWRASKADDSEVCEKQLCQQVWAVPPKPSVESLVNLDARALSERMAHPGRGFLPSDTAVVTMGIDIGKHLVHWVVAAWRGQARGQIVDYGVVETNARTLGEDRGIFFALEQLEDSINSGWKKGEIFQPAECVLIDSGYRAELIYEFCKRQPERLFPSKGFSTTEYSRPTALGRHTSHIGEGYHVERLPSTGGVKLIEIDADHWKSRLQDGYSCAIESPGAVTLFHSGEHGTHFSFAKHQTAERKEREMDRRRGEVVRWVNEHKRANHWFDAAVLAMVAGCHTGVKLNDDASDEPDATGGWFAQQRKR